MKIALLGDSHFGASRSSTILHNHFSQFYNFFFNYLSKHNITEIIQEGDLFDQRKDVHFATIKWSNENFFRPIKDSNINLTVISGNHDCTFKNHNRLNSVSLLCPKETKVIDLVPETILFGDKAIDFYPWISPENLDESMKFLAKSKSEFAVGHFEFVNFPMHPGSIATHGASHKEFSKYERVFSGHYHTISQQDNVLYTGTPYELTWSDCNDSKGFWVLDTETSKLEYIKSPYKLFEKITYIEDMDYDFTNVNEKYVKIVVVAKTSQKKFDEFVTNVNLNSPIDVKIIEASIIDKVSEAVDVTDLVTTKDMISCVIDTLDVNVDKDKLKNLVLGIYTEAMELSKV